MAVVRDTTILESAGSVDSSATPGPIIVAPDLVAGDLLLVAVFFAQGTGATNIFVPSGMEMVTIVGTGTNRLGAVFAAVVSDPLDFSGGVTLRSASPSTRVAAVAWSLAPEGDEYFTIPGLSTSGPDWNGSTMSSDTFPGGATGDLIFGISMTNKGASTTHSVHSGDGTAVGQARSLGGAAGTSVADSVTSVWLGGTGVTFAPAQSNGQAYSVGVNVSTASAPSGLPVKMGDGTPAHATFLDGAGTRMSPGSLRVFYPGFSTISEMEATHGATWAHRGGSLSFPEMSEYAYDRSCMLNYGALEFSARRTEDGQWFGIHDDTLARTSQDAGLTESVQTMSWSEIQAELNSLNSAGHPRPYYTLDEFLAKYVNHILVIDNKTGAFNVSEFLPKALASPNATDRIVLKIDGSLITTRFQEGKAAGFKVAGYWFGATYSSLLPARAPYTDYIGMEYSASETIWDDILTYDKMTWGHVCPDQSAYDTAILKGADFVQCSGVESIIPVQ